MGLYTYITRNWLDERFRRRSDAGVYLAHMPIYGLGAGDCELDQPGHLARVLRILRQLDQLEYETLLDVGGAEGFLPHLARTIHGVTAVTTDLSHEAGLRANELFGLPSAAVDCHLLPFADDAFDVVVCSEVIGHVEHPVETILELQRVARRAVILTTERVQYDRQRIDDYLFRRPGWPHMERNLFHPDDLAACFPGASLEPHCDELPPPGLEGLDATRDWLLENTTATELGAPRVGIVVTDVRDPAARCARRHADGALLDRLLATKIEKGSTWPARATVEDLVPLLRDPDKRAPLRAQDRYLVSPDGPRFPIAGDVPDLVRLERPAPSRAELESYLQRRHPERAEAVLALRDRLFLPERQTRDFFDLREREHRRGFWPNDQLRSRGGEGFSWWATGNDPWVVTPCLQRPVRELEIEMRVHAKGNPVESGTGQVFWKGPDDATFHEANSVKFRVPNDGRLHTHRVALTENPLLPDEIQWLRLDPIDGECEVDLLSLRLIS